MPETDHALSPLLDYLPVQQGFDFSGYPRDMLARNIDKRLAATACTNFREYLACLHQDADELERLIDVITINVSRFFRDSLTFELIADRILPTVVREKAEMVQAEWQSRESAASVRQRLLDQARSRHVPSPVETADLCQNN